jgi:hypothetical protein
MWVLVFNFVDNPLDDWPKDLIFLVRVASLLHGLCLQINVNKKTKFFHL